MKNYLNSNSEGKVLKVVEEEILEKVEQVLLEKEGSGCRALLANDKTSDLERMYRLFSRVEDGLNPMANIAKSYIASVGSSFVEAREARINAEEEGKEKNEDAAFINGLLDTHDKYVNMVEKHFGNHPLFQKSLQVREARSKLMGKKGGCLSS